MAAQTRRGWTLRRLLLTICAVVLVLVGILVVLAQKYDPVRVVYKRFKAPDVYTFEEIDPQYLETDPADLITIESPENAAETRRRLIRAIWGGDDDPFAKMPATVETGYDLPVARGIDGIGRMDRLTIPVDEVYTAYAYRLHPAAPNGHTVLYHHGYASNFEAAAPLLTALLHAGYDVLAFNNLAYGENRFKETVIPRVGRTDLRLWKFMDFLDRPMRFYFEPIIVGINYMIRHEGRLFVDAIGFSNGGWAITVASAVDERIHRSYPVSGGYPIYLRASDFKNQTQREHFYYPMLSAANYLEMYVLATFGDTPRRQMQIFNRYDRCCWRNLKGKLYEPAVKAAAAKIGKGAFDVVIDETHADHKVSAFAIRRILSDLDSSPVNGLQK